MFPRKITEKLIKQAKERKISLLLGARQVGKTTVLKHIYSELSKQNKCLFLDLDILSNYEKISTFESLVNTIKVSGYEEGKKKFFYLFLDEFQKYPGIVKIMKNVFDNLENIKIYASGSSSLSIKNQVQESLAGRKIINEIFPLDFEEFLWFRQENKAIETLKNVRKLSGKNLLSSIKSLYFLLEEFLVFGGYPEVALKNSEQEKEQVLESVFDLYVKKDLVEYLKTEKVLVMKKLIDFLAVNNGQKIKYEELSGITSLSFKEVKNYIEILKETYLIEILKPFYTNKNKELIKIPKIYFSDNGVRNYFIKNFNKLNLRNDAGFLFEGFVLGELVKDNKKEIKFWQEKTEDEVDFLINFIPIETKFKKTLKSEDFKGIDSFFKRYPKTKKGYIININSQLKKGKIILILPYKLGEIIK